MTRAAGSLLAHTIAAWAATWRFDCVGEEGTRTLRADRSPVIWAVWHGHLLPLLWLHRLERTSILVSQHADGERLAALAARWGYATLRGSSTRGSVAAIRGLLRALGAGRQVALAADGPRGPRERAKRGAVVVAMRTGAPILPVAASAAPAWRAKSWDRFLVPAPGARIRVAYGEPLSIPPNRHAIDAGMTALQARLDLVAHVAEC